MKAIAQHFVNHFLSAVDIFFPKRCVLCGSILPKGATGICLHCSMKLPFTGLHGQEGSKMERLFWGKLPLGKVSSYCYYRKGDTFCQVLHQLKYYGRKDLGISFGRQMAAELIPYGFFQGVDVLIPIPLHPQKERVRGYNQSYCLAQGVSEVTGIPIDHQSVVRLHFTDTQTHKSADERWINVSNVFSLTCPERFTNRHILLIDDVLTTGATLTACADTFRSVKGIHISILTLAWADF